MHVSRNARAGEGNPDVWAGMGTGLSHAKRPSSILLSASMGDGDGDDVDVRGGSYRSVSIIVAPEREANEGWLG